MYQRNNWIGEIVRAAVEESRRKGSTIRREYAEKNRLISQKLHNRLKSSKECQFCKKKFTDEIPQIHHIKPVIEGGTNEENNLTAICKECHKKVHGRS